MGKAHQKTDKVTNKQLEKSIGMAYEIKEKLSSTRGKVV